MIFKDTCYHVVRDRVLLSQSYFPSVHPSLPIDLMVNFHDPVVIAKDLCAYALRA